MHKLKLWTVICISMIAHAAEAQEKVGREKWLEEINREQTKIADYIMEQVETRSERKDAVCNKLLLEKEYQNLSKEKIEELTLDYQRVYYYKEYIDHHPETIKIYNPSRVSMVQKPDAEKPAGAIPSNMLCDYGDFESASAANLSSSGFTGYATPLFYYTGGLCSFIPNTNVAFPNVGFSDPNNFLVTDDIADPNVPAINQTHNNSKHAIRINGYQNCDRFGMNMLQKSFTSAVSGEARINFSYALVMQGPHDGSDAYGNAFFVARVLDENGAEVGSRICVPADATGNGFQATELPDCRHTTGYKARTLWRDWSCDYIDFDAEAGKTYTIEFFLSSCKWTVHFAYAYVDDICADITCCRNVLPPANLACTPVAGGSKLTWDAVPGAAYYRVYMTKFDRSCCADYYPPSMLSIWRNASNPSYTVPNTLVSCFSWFVEAIMPDSCRSAPSVRQCSCTPPPPAPVNLDCAPVQRGSKLTWTAVPGAAYYVVYMTKYDRACCSNDYPPSIQSIWRNTPIPSYIVPDTLVSCFSWFVQAVMPDSSRSVFSLRKCSCTPPPQPPAGLDCTSQPNGSLLSWNPVPGAAYYRVYMTRYDRSCCSPTSPPSTMTNWVNTTSTNHFVPNSLFYCFSWWVETIMPDSSRSTFSAKKCSCSPVGPGLIQSKITDGQKLSNDDLLSVTAIPNPASEYIEFTVTSNGKAGYMGEFSLRLFDINGKQVVFKAWKGSGKLRLDIRSFTTGLYTYEIRANNQALFKGKVLIERH